MNPLYGPLPNGKICFILHFCNSSGHWDQRDIGISRRRDIPHEIPQYGLGEVFTTKLEDTLFIIHAYVLTGKRNKHNLHPISYPHLCKCLIHMEDLRHFNCIIYIPRKTCLLNGGKPKTVLKVARGILRDLEIILY